MKEVIKETFQQKRVKYLTMLALLIVFAVTLNAAFAAFQTGDTRIIANISVAGMEYNMRINGETAREVNSCGGTTLFDIEITALNAIPSRYELIYRVCETNACTSFIPVPNNFEIKISSITPDDVFGEISATGTRTMRVAIINNTNTCYDILFDINAGFPHNTLARENLITNEYNESSFPEGSLLACLFDNNTMRSGSPTFNAEQNEEGIWRMPDEERNAYVFRGTHQGLNNNVIWAGYQWKVIRIEGSGNIRLVYNGLCPNNNCTINDATAGDNAFIEMNVFHDAGDDIRYVGYMHGDWGSLEGNIHQSTIAASVDFWFNHNISLLAREQTVETIFCSDRSAGTPLFQGYFFGGSDRFSPGNYGLEATLECPQEADKLLLRAGILTADEVSIAGASINNHFLMTGQNYWTMTPFNFTGGMANMFIISAFGTIEYEPVSWINQGVRPVVSLNSNVMANGNGSLTNPCVVQ